MNEYADSLGRRDGWRSQLRSFWQAFWRLPAQQNGEYFLPDFCDVRTVFVVVLAAELFALVLTLAGVLDGRLWQRLGLISLFVQWIVLTATALLCRLRPMLMRRTVAEASLAAMSIILLLTLATTFIVDLLLGSALALGRLGERYTLFLGNLSIAFIIGTVLLRYFYLQQAFRLRVRREAEARVQALQARIHPHFLFNTMNVLASLTHSAPLLAERVVEDLSALFRASLNVSGNLVPLAHELDLCRRYLNIEKLRLGERLQFEIDSDAQLAAVQVPLLSIQPLVENAVFHGVQARSAGGLVNVLVLDKANHIEIEVRNPLPETASVHAGHGLALANIRERLQVLYGSAADLHCGPDAGDYVARLRLPKIG